MHVVPAAHNLVGVHSVGETERWIKVDVVEQREVGLHRNVVLEAVPPLFGEVSL